MAAMMPMMATTISSSMRVKPLVSRIRMIGTLLKTRSLVVSPGVLLRDAAALDGVDVLLRSNGHASPDLQPINADKTSTFSHLAQAARHVTGDVSPDG